MSQPSNCGQCQDIFMADPLLQAEMRHLAITVSPGAAEAELNERLSDEHTQHGDEIASHHGSSRPSE